MPSPKPRPPLVREGPCKLRIPRFGAMRVDGFIDPDSFKRQIDEYIRVFRATKPAPGTNGPLIPGDPEREAEKLRRKKGIPLIMPIIEDLRDISRKTGIPFD